MRERVYRNENLTLVVTASGGTATVSWRGVSDSRFPAQFLGPIIDELGNDLQRLDVVIDLRELKYMNSSSVLPLIALIKRLDGNGKSVRVRFQNVDWQRTHHNCMSAMARTLKNVHIELG